ncbi:Mlo-related protein [Corchorus olitorius]|uniref:Mlo-related protein n=1 Tax=Corchorus olitorius TaxID=93759 RepID=A0A1R3KFC0_9ROSI|nr:Mlo-related protein [Corchorus olitorius]
MALYEALQKVKAELTVLGCISLLLTIGQSYISRICIPTKVADTMLFCAKRVDHPNIGHGPQNEPKPEPAHPGGGQGGHRRLLLFDRRFLAGGGGVDLPNIGHDPQNEPKPEPAHPGGGQGGHRRLLLFDRRFLAGGGGGPGC